jgi:hypothetical protein
MQLRFIHPFGAQVSAVVGAMALAACVRRRRKDRHNRLIEGERRKDRHNEREERTGIIV